jgi:hypothetical protein
VKAPLIQVTVRQLVEQALHIVKQQPKVLVPREILVVARRTINARSRCADWFKKVFTGTSDSSSRLQRQNDSHKHFIEMPKFLVKALEPNVSPDKEVKIKATMPANRHELLDFEDTIDDGISTVTELRETVGPNTTQTRKTGNLEEERDLDAKFRIICALVDFDNIHQHLKSVWTQYKADKDLITASVVTEVAF